MFKSLMPNIMVESVDETLTFYTEVLAFSIIQTVPNEKGQLNFAIVSKDDCVLSFQLKDNLIAEYPSLLVDTIKPSLTLFFKVEDASKLCEELSKILPITKQLHKTFYGTMEFAITDNNGNILTIASE